MENFNPRRKQHVYKCYQPSYLPNAPGSLVYNQKQFNGKVPQKYCTSRGVSERPGTEQAKDFHADKTAQDSLINTEAASKSNNGKTLQNKELLRPTKGRQPEGLLKTENINYMGVTLVK